MPRARNLDETFQIGDQCAPDGDDIERYPTTLGSSVPEKEQRAFSTSPRHYFFTLLWTV
ncbi:MAG TPA: hypothetical protein VHZ55_13745 [Bryobacteraceae bacterium]|jgi:hypothetical protein|nr:hypothetical protein [Bryobacteraceae bacterium]